MCSPVKEMNSALLNPLTLNLSLASWLLRLSVICFLCSTLTVNRVLSDQSLRVVVDNEEQQPIPPYRWYNHCTNTQRGFNVELYKRLAEDLNRPPIYITTEYNKNTLELLLATQKLLENEHADLAFTVPGFTPPNPNIIVAKEIILSNRAVLLTPSKKPKITSFAELASLKGAAVNPDEFVHRLQKKGINLNVHKVDSMETGLTALAAGNVDYWITDRHVATHLITTMGLEDKVKVANLTLGPTSGMVAMTSNTPEHKVLLNRIDELIKSYHQSGYLQRLKVNAMNQWMDDRGCSQPENSAVKSEK